MNAEKALMSCILQDQTVIGSEILSMFQRDNPFEDDVVRRVYHAWSTLPNRTSSDELITTMLEIEQKLKGAMNIDWLTEIKEIVSFLPHTVDWRKYLATVQKEYTRRCATTVLHSGLHDIDSAEDVQELLQRVSKELLSVDIQKETNELDPRLAVQEEQDRLRRGGLSTGIASIDELLGPLEPGEVLVVAARTSVGKSLLVGNIIRWLSVQNNVPGLVHSFEMPAAKCIGRMVASLTGKNSREVLGLYSQGEQEVVDSYERIFNAPIVWDERGSLSMAQIKNKLRRCSAQHSIKYAVLDHVGFIKLGYGKKNEELGKAIKEFKSECKELGVIPIIVVQLNRSSIEEEPGLHHLKASGDIEEDASQVILLHRETLLEPEERQRVAEGKPLPIKAGIAKTRYGETGYKQLALFLHSSLIQDNYVEDEDVPE